MKRPSFLPLLATLLALVTFPAMAVSTEAPRAPAPDCKPALTIQSDIFDNWRRERKESELHCRLKREQTKNMTVLTHQNAKLEGGSAPTCASKDGRTLLGDLTTLPASNACILTLLTEPKNEQLIIEVDAEGLYSLKLKGPAVLAATPPSPLPTAEASSGTTTREETTSACTQEDFNPLAGSSDDVHLRNHCHDRLCITPAGKLYGLTILSERAEPLPIELWAPTAAGITYELKVEYEKTLLLRSGVKPAEVRMDGVQVFALADAVRLPLPSPGTIKLTVTTTVASATRVPTNLKDQEQCTASTSFSNATSLTVTGHYHFMLGFMPTYVGTYDRRFTVHQGDDGVQRVFQQNIRELDYVATLSAYPWGVDPDSDRWAIGGLLGTSIRNPGKRWYFGAELSTPVFIGLSTGIALSVVEALDRDFQLGQPFSDTNVPTHTTVAPSWYFGVNVEAELFKKAFKGIVGDDK